MYNFKRPAVNEYKELLGLIYPYTREELRLAYRRKCSQYHPDKNKGENTALMQKIQEAYNFLRDNHSDKSFNDELDTSGNLESLLLLSHLEYYQHCSGYLTPQQRQSKMITILDLCARIERIECSSDRRKELMDIVELVKYKLEIARKEKSPTEESIRSTQKNTLLSTLRRWFTSQK